MFAQHLFRTILITVAVSLLTLRAAQGQDTAPPSGHSIVPEKRAILGDAPVPEIPPDEADAAPAGEPGDTDGADAAGDKSADAARVIYGDSLTCKGTGSYSLSIELRARPSVSCLGYVVDASTDSAQDMVILEDLRSLGSSGTYYVDAACSDLHKDFPAAGLRMGSTPWTSDSSDHWAYWVRKVAEAGVSRGYSFNSIQQSVWYITDRSGSYDSLPLLSAAGYSRSGPSKNARSTVVNNNNNGNNDDSNSGFDFYPTLGSGFCGFGSLFFLPLTALMLAGVRTATLRSQR